MGRLPMHPASGTGIITPFAKVIRFARYGCTNRPFYHIVVIERRKTQRKPPVEQVGTFDPYVNMYNEKLVAFNFERIFYWIGKGATISKPVAELLGLAGFLPIHPRTYMRAWRKRKADEVAAEKADTTQKSVASN